MRSLIWVPLGGAHIEIGDGRVAEGIAAELGNEIVSSVAVEAGAETADPRAGSGSAENVAGIVDGNAGGTRLQIFLVGARVRRDGSGGAHRVRKASAPLA
jgi:hypothetical protein